MKKFRFRLEPVLRYRQRVKNEKKQVLALKNVQLQESQDALDRLLQAQLANAVSQNANSVAFVQMTALYAARLKKEITFQLREVDKAQEQVDLALQDYIEATREAKVLETLKEKKREQYMEYVRKEEDKFLDELTVQRAGFTPR